MCANCILILHIADKLEGTQETMEEQAVHVVVTEGMVIVPPVDIHVYCII